jgi:uncharacterized protein YbjT (DUF2867 family)
MAKVLVTGGTGTLGREVVSRLLDKHYSTRILSHKSKPSVPRGVEVYVGDLETGTGLRDATKDVDAIVHCASKTNGINAYETDVEGTRKLIESAKATGSPHFVYISIVGVDKTQFSYYKAKYDAELLIEKGEVPWTIQRATQYHNYLLSIIQSFGADTLSEIPVPSGMRFQSIDVGEVADHLISLVERGPSGRTPYIGGPQVLALEEMAETYLRIRGRKATIQPKPIPNDMYDMFRTGIHLCPDRTEGKITWEEFVRRLYGEQRLRRAA